MHIADVRGADAGGPPDGRWQDSSYRSQWRWVYVEPVRAEASSTTGGWQNIVTHYTELHGLPHRFLSASPAGYTGTLFPV